MRQIYLSLQIFCVKALVSLWRSRDDIIFLHHAVLSRFVFQHQWPGSFKFHIRTVKIIKSIPRKCLYLFIWKNNYHSYILLFFLSCQVRKINDCFESSLIKTFVIDVITVRTFQFYSRKKCISSASKFINEVEDEAISDLKFCRILCLTTLKKKIDKFMI